MGYGKINAVLSGDMRLLVSPLNISFVAKIFPPLVYGELTFS